MKTAKHTFFAIGTVLLTLILLLVSGELAARLYLKVRYSKPDGSQILVLDDARGWRVCPHFSFRGTRTDMKGDEQVIQIRTDGNGFRVNRDSSTGTTCTIMFVGDSFTMALDASDEAAYYGRLSGQLNATTYAYGAGGYGTLQELMVIREFYPLVQPDIVILQLCGNDIINNSYELEAASRRNNNAMRRPYADRSGRIFYAMPGGFPRQLPAVRHAINKHSRLLYFVFSRMDRLQSLTGTSVEDIIHSQGMRYPPYRDAVETTRYLLRQIRDSVPAHVPVFAFCVDDNQELPRLVTEADMEFIHGVPEALAEAESNGITTRASDGAHWSENGHAIAARVLYDHLIKHIAATR